MARAFQLGRAEAAAVNNLVHKVAPEAVAFLENSVKRRGMLKYMSHDIIRRDLLNEGYTSGVGILEPWKDELRNDGEQKLVTHHEFQELLFGTCLPENSRQAFFESILVTGALSLATEAILYKLATTCVDSSAFLGSGRYFIEDKS